MKFKHLVLYVCIPRGENDIGLCVFVSRMTVKWTEMRG